MCLLARLAKKINIFGRDISNFTKVDVIFTYSFIAACIIIVSIYSNRYFRDAELVVEECSETEKYTYIQCIESEFIHIVVPFLGVLHGFLITFHSWSSRVGLGINYICHCFYCCNPDKNINNLEPEIQLNELGLPSNDDSNSSVISNIGKI
jgi:hypothetical protein